MSKSRPVAGMARNVALYPWFRFFQNLLFWQAIWFLFFQERLSAAEAILLYAVYDIATTILELPSGYFSDRAGRRLTLLASSLFSAAGVSLLALAEGFTAFAAGQALLGAGAAFASGTDSSLLFESLHADGRSDEIEAQELRAWRFGFSALAVSAVTGGLLSLWSFEATFGLAALAYVAAFTVAWSFVEPPRDAKVSEAEALRFSHLRQALRNPVVVWLFCLGVLMYGYSHLPFVFGQPFILDALASIGFAAEVPAVSGAVTTVMMLVSVVASLAVPAVRRRIGLPAILLAAFALQIGLAAVLAATSATAAIAVLLLRMVPESVSGPLIIARLQPLLSDDSRATLLSIKSLVGRLIFASSLVLAAMATTDVAQMSHTDIQTVLGWYVGAGVAALVTLALAARGRGIEVARTASGGN